MWMLSGAKSLDVFCKNSFDPNVWIRRRQRTVGVFGMRSGLERILDSISPARDAIGKLQSPGVSSFRRSILLVASAKPSAANHATESAIGRRRELLNFLRRSN